MVVGRLTENYQLINFKMPKIYTKAISNYGKNVVGGAKIVGKAIQKGAIVQNQKNINSAKKALPSLMGRPTPKMIPVSKPMGRPSAGMIKKMGFKK